MHEVKYRSAAFIVAVAVMVSGFLILNIQMVEAVDSGMPLSGPATDVWDDTTSPAFDLLSPPEDEYQLEPFQIVRIKVTDEQSWVDAGSIEYRLTTQGLRHWTQWMPYTEAIDGPIVHVTIREHFRRGDDNYVQVRASDLAGNPFSTSRAFKIRINTIPEVVVTSPSPGDPLTVADIIEFDASTSYDRDGDALTFEWYRSTPSGPVLIGDSDQISCSLPAGEYSITVVATDSVHNQGRAYLIIRVMDEEKVSKDQDSDGDGIPDEWEMRFQLDPSKDDTGLDPDDDGFTNLQEYESSTNPINSVSKPPILTGPSKDDTLKLFSPEAWPIWAFLMILILLVIITISVIKLKNERQVRRIRRIRLLSEITPSVSWDHVTITASLGPLTRGLTMPANAGARHTLPPPNDIPLEHVALPAIEIENRERSPGPIEEPAPAPAQEIHSSQAGNKPPPAMWIEGITARRYPQIWNEIATRNGMNACENRSGGYPEVGPRSFPFGRFSHDPFSEENSFPSDHSISSFDPIEFEYRFLKEVRK
ncbi:MAG: hypothetical protein ACMUFK_00455 [Thermoplasmatota archaeon]